MRKTFQIIILIFAIQSMCHAVSVEITTGGGGNEGIKASSGDWLKDGSRIQILRANSDELVSTLASGYNFPFDKNKGKFDYQVWAEAGERIYVRAWDETGRYGDSETYVVKGIEGEVWNLAGENGGPAAQINTTLKSD
jgi:hypothetical protein